MNWTKHCILYPAVFQGCRIWSASAVTFAGQTNTFLSWMPQHQQSIHWTMTTRGDNHTATLLPGYTLFNIICFLHRGVSALQKAAVVARGWYLNFFYTAYLCKWGALAFSVIHYHISRNRLWEALKYWWYKDTMSDLSQKLSKVSDLSLAFTKMCKPFLFMSQQNLATLKIFSQLVLAYDA